MVHILLDKALDVAPRQLIHVFDRMGVFPGRGGATRIADTGFVGTTTFIRILRSETDADEGAVCVATALRAFFVRKKPKGGT